MESRSPPGSATRSPTSSTRHLEACGFMIFYTYAPSDLDGRVRGVFGGSADEVLTDEPEETEG